MAPSNIDSKEGDQRYRYHREQQHTAKTFRRTRRSWTAKIGVHPPSLAGAATDHRRIEVDAHNEQIKYRPRREQQQENPAECNSKIM
ncbi:hypothetical protein NL676_001803 [Syzygium grande]|nr:hypothetical protein NL676_001803 [Syzygium grande]